MCVRPSLTVQITLNGRICEFHISWQTEFLGLKRCNYQNFINPLIATLKPQSNGPSHSNTVIGTLAIDWWAVTFVQ